MNISCQSMPCHSIPFRPNYSPSFQRLYLTIRTTPHLVFAHSPAGGMYLLLCSVLLCMYPYLYLYHLPVQSQKRSHPKKNNREEIWMGNMSSPTSKVINHMTNARPDMISRALQFHKCVYRSFGSQFTPFTTYPDPGFRHRY